MLLLLISLSTLIFLDFTATTPSPRMHGCGDDLKHLLNFVCTYPTEQLPCYAHFLDTKKENPLEIIEAMKHNDLKIEYYDPTKPPIPINNHSMTTVEECCHYGCSIVEVKKKYCCFTEECLDLCYPGEFDVFRA